MNHCQPSRRVTHCRCWLLERELWCFWGWTSRPAGDWRSRLQHRRRRWISPWNIWSKHMRENIVLIISRRWKKMKTGTFIRSYSPVLSVEIASQSGTNNHSNPKTQTQFGQGVCSVFRFRQVGDDHLRSYKEWKVSVFDPEKRENSTVQEQI